MEPPILLSLINLIASPERYDGKQVAVEGFLSLELDGTYLFLHREDWEYGLFQNACWVSIRYGELTLERAKQLHHQYVRLEATFRREAVGHMGVQVNGTLCDVKKYDVCPRARDVSFPLLTTTDEPKDGAN
ncbi:Uncharacterized protein OS=Arenimonas oryziterrae DSM 21050 = YC6267 GN=N789_05560 PE=4 SV=1 [Gemmata massiliana]|uniref:Uncharacterized protein n=1 Tax=Gemmata massiliana TaxID=1210884 RepID=A0A6P2CXN9_9BACT|nr:hypothetical protein [Gemmata massiliana]VTR93908.1 Uncharacterized protein OS=Arenimonas oryziterrae DSM 21050 = YC6267 GN=N789_05560 PE=4 SV=1 [Gemmata massiliana]